MLNITKSSSSFKSNGILILTEKNNVLSISEDFFTFISSIGFDLDVNSTIDKISSSNAYFFSSNTSTSWTAKAVGSLLNELIGKKIFISSNVKTFSKDTKGTKDIIFNPSPSTPELFEPFFDSPLSVSLDSITNGLDSLGIDFSIIYDYNKKLNRRIASVILSYTDQVFAIENIDYDKPKLLDILPPFERFSDIVDFKYKTQRDITIFTQSSSIPEKTIIDDLTFLGIKHSCTSDSILLSSSGAVLAIRSLDGLFSLSPDFVALADSMN
jgi:hypothetical protein